MAEIGDNGAIRGARDFAEAATEHFNRMQDDETYRRMVIRGTSPQAVAQAAQAGLTWREYQQAIESAEAHCDRLINERIGNGN